MTPEEDIRHMAHALRMAQRGLGQTWPNPAVGCVIVKQGRILGRGTTAPEGRPHAEPQALAQAGEAARGATAYVTLEPCAHHGKTGPCAEALIKAGVARVVSALTDPDPRVSGGGLQRLRDAGIAVTTGVLEAEARAAQRGFLTRIQHGRPMLTLKLALTLDGRIATASGESRWITGPQSRARVHLMRATHDAVLVGAGTARADDPELTVRDLGVLRQPLRLIAARDLDLPARGRLAASIPQGPLWLLHGPDAPQDRRDLWLGLGAKLVEVPLHKGHLDVAAMMRILGDKGLTRVFCEGGGQFASALLQARMVDHLHVFSAGMVIGADGRAGLGTLGLTALADAQRFQFKGISQTGADLWHAWEIPFQE